MTTKAKPKAEVKETPGAEGIEETEEQEGSSDPPFDAEAAQVKMAQEMTEVVWPHVINSIAAKHKVSPTAMDKFLRGQEVKNVKDLEAKAIRWAESVAEATAGMVPKQEKPSPTTAAIPAGIQGAPLTQRKLSDIPFDPRGSHVRELLKIQAESGRS